MKKSFIAMLMALVLAFPVFSVSTADTAEAACGTSFARSGQNGQFTVKNYDVRDSTFYIQPILVYKLCGRKAVVSNMYINLRKNDSNACAKHIITGFHINGNVVGNYNPATQYRTCNDSQTNYQAAWNPSDFAVKRAASSNKRCFGGEVRVAMTGRSDPTYTSFSVCIPARGQR